MRTKNKNIFSKKKYFQKILQPIKTHKGHHMGKPYPCHVSRHILNNEPNIKEFWYILDLEILRCMYWCVKCGMINIELLLKGHIIVISAEQPCLHGQKIIASFAMFFFLEGYCFSRLARINYSLFTLIAAAVFLLLVTTVKWIDV
ncbi:hypothetical protein ACJX0J_026560 [Zea mays]